MKGAWGMERARTVTLAVGLALAIAACGGPAEPLPSRSPAAGSSSTPGHPAPSAAAGPTRAPSARPSASPAPSGTPGRSPAAGAEACSGSAENRDFFSVAAGTFTWDVYCAILPDGWFVDTGSYRLADGGRLEVAYKGPDGRRIELREGSYCTTGASACSPRDHELGPAAYGDRTGTLVTLGPSPGDGFAIYVDPGAAPSWEIVGSGLDQAAFESIAAALHRVLR